VTRTVYLTGHHYSLARRLCDDLQSLKVGVTSGWHHYPRPAPALPASENVERGVACMRTTPTPKELAEMLRHDLTFQAIADAIVWVPGVDPTNPAPVFPSPGLRLASEPRGRPVAVFDPGDPREPIDVEGMRHLLAVVPGVRVLRTAEAVAAWLEEG